MSLTINQRIKKNLAGIAAAGLAFAGLAAVTPAARAWSPWKSGETAVTFSGPVAVPNKVLPAGTYVFKWLEPEQSQTIVGIFDANGKRLLDTELAAPAERQRIDWNAKVVMSESAGTPAVREIFPGERSAGYEFVYRH
jgi:hypothetical protein